MLLKVQKIGTEEIIQEVEIAWGYVDTYKGKTTVHYISMEDNINHHYEFHEINIDNDNVMVHILP